jgi:hypothetical protein
VLAIEIWHSIAEMRGLESRHYLQAWYFLRQQGVDPPKELAKVLLGVVLEVPMKGGLDLLAAYADRGARYYNFSGRGAIWDHPNASLDGPIDALLANGRRILNAIGPHLPGRPPPPPAGQVRINLLSPAGLHFGQAPFAALAADPLAKSAIDAATALMMQLTKIGAQQGK